MAPKSYKRIIFASIPRGFPVPNETTVTTTYELDADEVKLGEGEFVTKTIYLGLDPYMRGRMRAPELKSYRLPFIVGEPIWSYAISKIIKSNSPNFKKGEVVYGLLPWEEVTIVTSKMAEVLKVVENKEGLPLSNWVGIAGRTGMTAYTSFYEYAFPRFPDKSTSLKGERIFISAASGAVGQVVAQIAKREGMLVYGSAGSDSKVDYLINELGFDGAFNYKTAGSEKEGGYAGILEELKKISGREEERGDGGIQVYYDNVGGETLDAYLMVASTNARIISCGMISQYNDKSGEQYGVKNLMQIVARTLSINGFLTTTLMSKYTTRFLSEVPLWLKNGEINYRENITDGIENAGQAFLEMLQGKNFGKAIVRVSKEEED